MGDYRPECRRGGLLSPFLESPEDGLTYRVLAGGRAVTPSTKGSYSILSRPYTRARNPKTGETVSVAAHGVAAFRPRRELRKQAWAVNATPGPKP